MIDKQNTLRLVLSIILVFIPLVLYWVDGFWRTSISDYAYSDKNYVFDTLVTSAGMLFIFSSVGFDRHWYNLILGLALIGVVLTPHRDYPIIHYTCAAAFFIGSVIVVFLSRDNRLKGLKLALTMVIVIVLFLHFVFGWLELLWIEWICLLPISSILIINVILINRSIRKLLNV